MEKVKAPICFWSLFLHMAPNANLELTIGDALGSKQESTVIVIQWLQILDDTGSIWTSLTGVRHFSALSLNHLLNQIDSVNWTTYATLAKCQRTHKKNERAHFWPSSILGRNDWQTIFFSRLSCSNLSLSLTHGGIMEAIFFLLLAVSLSARCVSTLNKLSIWLHTNT